MVIFMSIYSQKSNKIFKQWQIYDAGILSVLLAKQLVKHHAHLFCKVLILKFRLYEKFCKNYICYNLNIKQTFFKKVVQKMYLKVLLPRYQSVYTHLYHLHHGEKGQANYWKYEINVFSIWGNPFKNLIFRNNYTMVLVVFIWHFT